MARTLGTLQKSRVLGAVDERPKGGRVLGTTPKSRVLGTIPEEEKKIGFIQQLKNLRSAQVSLQTGDLAESPDVQNIIDERNKRFERALEIGIQAPLGFAEAAGLGLPSKILGKETFAEAETDSRLGRFLRGVGTTAGFAFGAPRQIFAKGAPLGVKLFQALRGGRQLGKVGKTAAKAAGGLGLLEALKIPEEGIAEKLITVPVATTTGALLGAGAAKIAPVIKRGFSRITPFIKNLVSRLARNQGSVPKEKALVPIRGDTFVLRPNGTGFVIPRAEKADLIIKVTQEKTAQQVRSQLPSKPEFVGNIRLSKFPKPAQETLKQIVSEKPETVLTEKISDAKVKDMSQKIQKTGNFNIINTIFKKPKGTLAAEINAVREQTADAVLNMTDDIDAVLAKVKTTAQITGEPGLALRQFRQPLGKEVAAVERIDQAIREAVDPAVRTKLSEIKQIVGRRALNPNIWDKIVEWATAIKLSSPKTPFRALIGNTFNKILKFPQRALSPAIDRAAAAISGRGRERFGQEVLADIVGSSRGLKTGAQTAFKILQNENIALEEATRAGEVIIARGAIKGPGFGRIGKALGVKNLGELIRFPFRLVAAPDVLIREADKAGEIASLAVRQAVKEGLKGAALQARVGQLISKPTEEIVSTATANAAKTVFQEPLTGQLAKLNSFRQSSPLMRLIVPFFRTPVNLAKATIRKGPLTALLPSSRQAITQLFREGGGKGADVIAEAAVGSAIIGGLIAHAWEGNITGRGPKNKAERDALFREGWQPNSVKIGNQYFSYQGLEPLADFLQIAATIAENKEETSDKKVKKIIFDLTKNFANQPFLTGVNDLLSAFDNENNFERFLRRFAAGNVVPTGVRGITQAVSPTLRKPEGVVQEIKARIPGLEQEVLPRRNVFGEEIVIGGSALARFISPSRVSVQRITPIDAELKRLGVTIRFPGTRTNNLELTPEEYDELLQRSGSALKQDLAGLILMPEYWLLGVDDKIKLIKDLETENRREVNDEILARKVMDGVDADGLEFLERLDREDKLTNKVETMGAAYLEELGLIKGE